MTSFYGWGLTVSRLEPLRRGSLIFTTMFPEIGQALLRPNFGLMVKAVGSNLTGLHDCFPGLQSVYRLNIFDIANFSQKLMMEVTEGLILLFQCGVLAMFWLKPWSTRVASHHSAFMGNWSTVIHTFLTLSTQQMSSPLRK